MWTNPQTPNPADFQTFVYGQGVPQADLPSGVLSGASISLSGSLTASGSSGTVAQGMVLVLSTSAPYTFITAWDSSTLSGTVSPLPATALSDQTIGTYTPSLVWAFQAAFDRCMSGNGYIPASVYIPALYNLGMHHLLKIGQDVPGETFFQDMRAQYKLLSFTGGVVTSAADQNTSSTVTVPDLFKNLNMSNLDLLKTPWGREYMGYAMNYGPYIVGMS